MGTSATFPINISALQPTLLAPSSFLIGGKQYVGALTPPDYRSAFALPVGAVAGVTSRPAKPGETVVMYGLGFGDVTPPVPTGLIAPTEATILNLPLQILFGQTAAKVSYMGLVAGLVSLYQFNVEIPQIADNDAVPLTFALGGVPGAQTLHIAVHQ
jgi:uncharacterized protein (TIGR03437 family)